MAGIDPYTGEPIPDDAGTTLNQSGPTASRPFSMSSGFGAAPAAPMRGPAPQFPWGGGAKPAMPMRGPAYPQLPYPVGPRFGHGSIASIYRAALSGNGFVPPAREAQGFKPGDVDYPFHLPQWRPLARWRAPSNRSIINSPIESGSWPAEPGRRHRL